MRERTPRFVTREGVWACFLGGAASRPWPLSDPETSASLENHPEESWMILELPGQAMQANQASLLECSLSDSSCLLSHMQASSGRKQRAPAYKRTDHGRPHLRSMFMPLLLGNRAASSFEQ